MKIAKARWFKRYARCVVRLVDREIDFDCSPSQTHVVVCTPVKRKWRRRYPLPPIVTRATVIRAFSTPDRTRGEVLAIVAKYIGDSSVPPSWGRLGVRGTFGKGIERLWARHIRPLRVASYQDAESGHWLTPVIQTFYDFGTTPEKMRELEATISAQPPAENTESAGKALPVILDEAWMMLGAYPPVVGSR